MTSVDASRRWEWIDRFRTRHMPGLHSVLIGQSGRLLCERYYAGVERDLRWIAQGGMAVGPPYELVVGPTQLHNLKSVTKSVLSALVGIAVAEGIIELDGSIADYLGSRHSGEVSSEKAAITIDHLLSMRSGLEWQENGPITLEWANSEDPASFSLNQQTLAAEPGRRWNYSTADAHLLGECLAAAAGSSLVDFARSRLFQRLGFGGLKWEADSTGAPIGGSELYLTPRDMLAFGTLYLGAGTHAGRQIIDSVWVSCTTAAQIGVTRDAILQSLEVCGDPWPGDLPFHRTGYGRGWWRLALAGRDCYAAQGFGGQLVAVVTDLELVIVQTAQTWGDEGETRRRSVEGLILAEEIISRAKANGLMSVEETSP